MRLAPALLAVVAGCATAPPPPPRPPVQVVLDLTHEVTGAEPAPGLLRDAVRDGLARFGVAAGAAATPGAPPPLRVSGRLVTRYDDAAFFGQALAHNFHGELDVALLAPDGAPLEQVAFSHSWGRLPKNATAAEVQAEYEDMVLTPVVVVLLAHPEVQARVPPEQRSAAQAWLLAERDRVRSRIARSISESEVVTRLDGVSAGATGE